MSGNDADALVDWMLRHDDRSQVLSVAGEKVRLGITAPRDVDIFREANIPLFTREQELNNEYDKTMAAMTVVM